MKRSKLNPIIRVGAMIIALIALLVTIFVNDTTTGAELIGVASAIIPGTITTSEIQSVSGDLLINQIEQKIVEVAPAVSPLDTLIRHIPDRGKTKSLKVEFYKVDYKGISDTVATSVSGANQESFNLKVNNIKMWAETDTLFVKGVNAYDEDNALIAMQDLELYVYGIDRGESILRVQPVNGYTLNSTLVLKSGDDIALNAVIVRGGRAGQENDIQTTPYVDMPQKDYNLPQKFMAQIQESTWARIHDKEAKWGWDEYTRRQLGNMKIDKELSYIQGARRIINNVDNQGDVYMTGGATQFISGLSDISGVTFENAMFQKLSREIFEDNNGSDQRVLLTGHVLMQNFGKIDDVTKQTSAKSRETAFGLTFNRINTNFGEILMVKHPLFSKMGMSHMGLCVDLHNLAERSFEPLRTEELNLKKAGISDTKAKVLIETSCPLWRNVGTHRWIKGPTS